MNKAIFYKGIHFLQFFKYKVIQVNNLEKNGSLHSLEETLSEVTSNIDVVPL
jgi:hypothetical protein